MVFRCAESEELYRVMVRKGYAPEFCRVISEQLGTPWTANRMIGYLRQVPKLHEEDIVDEMLGILGDRDRIIQKKEMEYYQAKLNQLYENGIDG